MLQVNKKYLCKISPHHYNIDSYYIYRVVRGAERIWRRALVVFRRLGLGALGPLGAFGALAAGAGLLVQRALQHTGGRGGAAR